MFQAVTLVLGEYYQVRREKTQVPTTDWLYGVREYSLTLCFLVNAAIK